MRKRLTQQAPAGKERAMSKVKKPTSITTIKECEEALADGDEEKKL